MISKRSLFSVIFGATMLALLPCQSMAVHVISDMPQKMEVYADEVQMAKATVTENENYKQTQDIYATIGEKDNNTGPLLRRVENGLENESVKYPKSYVSESLKKKGVEEAQKDAEKMQALIKNKLVSVDNNETLEEATERAKLRQALKEDATADAAATSLAYLSESTKAQEEKLNAAKSTIEEKETLKDKADGTNEVLVAILREVMEGNRLTATQLRLMSASELAEMPVFKEEQS